MTDRQMTDHKENTAKSKEAGDIGGDAPFDPVAGKSVAEIFGEIVWLLSQDKKARDLSIKDLEWLVMPPILLKQFHILYAPSLNSAEPSLSAQKAALQPISVELFAFCSDAVASLVDANSETQVRLVTSDWRSGPHKRLVARFGVV
jgi:cytolysin-activating lysine-acyltransferase